ncbi:MAG: glycosyltransferase family 39 protein [Proteobacteria bacterium]|nr:glycosyltransferase family 39 protein [Pseudomonadota bacterium]
MVRSRVLIGAALALVLVLAAGARWRLLDVPLERDEGEYAYAAQLILRGVPPYEHVYSMKPPGTVVAYAAVLAAFGETARGVHLGLLVVNAITIAVIFLLGRRLYGDSAGIAAAAGFAALSLGASVQGVFANAEHFVVLFATGGLLLLLRAAETPRLAPLVGSGLLFGCAILMKQHGAAFAAAGLVFLAVRSRGDGAPRRCAVFAAAVAVPALMTGVALWWAGSFETFWLWTVHYAYAYTGQLPVAPADWLERIGTRSLRVVRPARALWLLAAVGLSALVWSRAARPHRLFLGLLTGFSVLAVLPGLYLRPHYFVLLLPSVALLFGVAVAAFAERLASPRTRAAVVAALVIVPIAHTAYQQRGYLFRHSPVQVARLLYGLNPFPESLRVAEYLAEHTRPEDRVVVIGSEPQIYFYADRRAATGFIYTYALGEDHRYAESMQRQMIGEIEASDPAYLVWVRVPGSWGPRRVHAARILLGWLEAYLDGYELALVVDIAADGTRYYEGAEIASRGEPPGASLEIYRRRDFAP